VQHVVERARQCKRIGQVLVATDDQRIVEALAPFRTHCVMTSAAHPSGTDRIAEVAKGLNADILVNVQGDEPEIDPDTIDSLVERLANTSDDMATAATPFPADADVADPNLVKVVVGLDGRALYFSRSPIPHVRDANTMQQVVTFYLHQGIYAYRRQFLLAFAAWPPTPLEKIEKLEQLRVLEHGRSMYVLKTRRLVHGIDTPEQYAEFVKRYKMEAGS